MNETKGVGSEQVKGKKSFGKKFMSFLSMGGFLLIIVLIVIIAIVIDNLTR